MVHDSVTSNLMLLAIDENVVPRRKEDLLKHRLNSRLVVHDMVLTVEDWVNLFTHV